MSNSKRLTVSIVIPAYNEADYIEKCLRSCLSQSVLPYEVLVVDNMSIDSTPTIVRRIARQNSSKVKIRLLRQSKEQGIRPTRDYGFDRATGDIIGRIDADTILMDDWVSVVQDTFMENGDVSAITGPVSYHDMPAKSFSLKMDTRIRTLLFDISKESWFLFGTNMALRREAWRQVRSHVCMDGVTIHEDLDLSVHLSQMNMKISYIRDMIASMSARRLDDTPRAFYSYMRKFDRTYSHHGISDPVARVPVFVYLMIYFPSKMVRVFYDPDKERISLKRLKRVVIGADAESIVDS